MRSQVSRFMHYGLATVAGSGYFPKAPGTAGSLVAVLFFWFVPLPFYYWAGILFLMFALGVWSATCVESYEGKDPGKVVIDEFVGQGLALLLVPHQWYNFAAGFILFRLFDIFKPFPVKQAEKLPAGWGIMADDVVAGLYALGVLQLVLWVVNIYEF